ncbi:MAG: hypothetical protein IKW71_02720, partial [Elusimicrobiaceae bacterium]|nr:hypothetical protein [Elusimicrobiaceae bacterium]
MNYPCIRALIIGLLLAASGAEVCAQRIPAWTRRLTPATWQQLTRATRFFPNGRAPFITFPQVLTLTPTVRTTDRKFI